MIYYMSTVFCSCSEITLFMEGWETNLVSSMKQSRFFQNEEIFVKLDELDELDRITHA